MTDSPGAFRLWPYLVGIAIGLCAGFALFVYLGARNIDDRTRLPAIFCRGILLNIELLNRIDRQDGRGISRDASSIDYALPGKWFAVE